MVRSEKEEVRSEILFQQIIPENPFMWSIFWQIALCLHDDLLAYSARLYHWQDDILIGQCSANWPRADEHYYWPFRNFTIEVWSRSGNWIICYWRRGKSQCTQISLMHCESTNFYFDCSLILFATSTTTTPSNILSYCLLADQLLLAWLTSLHAIQCRSSKS